MINKEINERLKSVRAALNLTQSEFADRIDIKQGSLSDIERYKVNVSTRVAASIEDKLHVNTEWLYTGKGDMFKEFYKEVHIENTHFYTHNDNTQSNAYKKDDEYHNKYERQKLKSSNSIKLGRELLNLKGELNGFYNSIHELNELTAIINDISNNYWGEIGTFLTFVSDEYIDNKRFNYKSFKENGINILESNKHFSAPLQELVNNMKEFIEDIRPLDHKKILDDHDV